MKVVLKRIGVLRTGIFLAAFYGLLAIIFCPFFGIAFFISPQKEEVIGGLCGMMMILFFYPLMGLIGGIIMAFIYNLVARAVGGLEFNIEIESPARQAGENLPV